MPSFCIDRSVLGTVEHLVVDDGVRSWSPVVPPGAHHLDGRLKPGSDRCMDTLLRLGGMRLDLSPPERFVAAMSLMSGSLGEGPSPVPWQKALPAAAHQGFTDRLIDEGVVSLTKAPRDYYEGTYVPGDAVLRSLRPAYVDPERVRRLLRGRVGNADVVRTFTPGPDGFAAPVAYHRTNTLTGRLTVASGPQVLTLKRDYRDLLVSRYGAEGSVLMLDFAALEVRVLLYEHGRSCDDPDLYSMIGREIGADRKAVKGAVISELYGSSKHALGKVLGMQGKELDAFVKRVRAYFGTADLLKRIKRQFLETGKVIDRYGRPVSIDEPLDHVMINYYAQATGVDVALLGFSQVVSRLATEAPLTVPLFVLHDALLLDVHRDDLKAVVAVKDVKVPGYEQRFPLRLERLG